MSPTVRDLNKDRGVTGPVYQLRNCCFECGRPYDEKLPAGISWHAEGISIDGEVIKLSAAHEAILRTLLRVNGRCVTALALYFAVVDEEPLGDGDNESGADTDGELGHRVIVLVKELQRKLRNTRIGVIRRAGIGYWVHIEPKGN